MAQRSLTSMEKTLSEVGTNQIASQANMLPFIMKYFFQPLRLVRLSMIRRRGRAAVVLLALLLLVPALLPVPRSVNASSSRGNIIITNNQDFSNCGCVTSGAGTPTSPYQVSGLTLTTQSGPGILVDNSQGKITKYFDVAGDTINGGPGSSTSYPGVEFINVNAIGEITGSANAFNGNRFGVYLLNSYNILVDGGSSSNGATINNNGVDGIAVVGGGSNTISNLQVNHNGIGIPEGFFFGGVGIALNFTSGNTVKNIVLSEDAMAGLAMFSSSNNLIEGISVHYPDFVDAVVDGGSSNTLEQNVFQTGDYIGLWLRDSTSSNLISGNSFLAIGPTGKETTDGIAPYFISGMYLSSGSASNKIENNLFSRGDPIDQDNGALFNPLPGQVNNIFNDPLTGNEPAIPLFPSGPAGTGNMFCGNLVLFTQGVPSNPPSC